MLIMLRSHARFLYQKLNNVSSILKVLRLRGIYEADFANMSEGNSQMRCFRENVCKR